MDTWPSIAHASIQHVVVESTGTRNISKSSKLWRYLACGWTEPMATPAGFALTGSGVFRGTLIGPCDHSLRRYCLKLFLITTTWTSRGRPATRRYRQVIHRLDSIVYKDEMIRQRLPRWFAPR